MSDTNEVPATFLIGILIRDYPEELSEAIEIFKEFLDGTHHITEYCYLKPDCDVTSEWNLNLIKPGNFYIFPDSRHFEYHVLANLIWSISRIPKYIIINSFTLDDMYTGGYPLEYYSSAGTILIDNSNKKYTQDY